jgi:hypothetical protein
MLLQLVRRVALPPSFLLVWRVEWLLALQLWALEDTVPLIVALEAKFLLLVSLTLLRSNCVVSDTS